MSDARRDILARVRSALRTPTVAGAPAGKTAEGSALPGAALPGAAYSASGPSGSARDRLPPVPTDRAEWPSLFGDRLRALSGTFLAAADPADAARLVNDLALTEGWKRVAAQTHPNLVAATSGLPTRVEVVSGANRFAHARCDAGLTTCRALVVQTGSVLVTAADGGRAGSVLPPHHIVLATRDQLVPDLPSAWSLFGVRPPSFISLITGPSRTADIERTLVLGAHGPVRLTVVLIG